MIDFLGLSQMCGKNDFLYFVSKNTGINIVKIDEGMEYEIKFAVAKSARSLFEINNDISNILEKANYFVNRVERKTDYYVDFFCSHEDGFEYSVFIYESKMMMKIKKHNKVEHGAFTVCESKETFEYDYTRILNILRREDLVYVGTMRKERVKDFIIDKLNGLIYASAISKCSILDKYQMQYELEYYSHFRGVGTCIDKNKIIQELIKISGIIVEVSNNTYYPDNQTKLEFVEENWNQINTKNKEEVIDKIKEKMRLETEVNC